MQNVWGKSVLLLSVRNDVFPIELGFFFFCSKWVISNWTRRFPFDTVLKVRTKWIYINEILGKSVMWLFVRNGVFPIELGFADATGVYSFRTGIFTFVRESKVRKRWTRIEKFRGTHFSGFPFIVIVVLGLSERTGAFLFELRFFFILTRHFSFDTVLKVRTK